MPLIGIIYGRLYTKRLQKKIQNINETNIQTLRNALLCQFALKHSNERHSHRRLFNLFVEAKRILNSL